MRLQYTYFWRKTFEQKLGFSFSLWPGVTSVLAQRERDTTVRKSWRRGIRCCNFDPHSVQRSPAIGQWSCSIHFFEEKVLSKKWGLVLVFGLVWPQFSLKYKTPTVRKSLRRGIRCCNFDPLSVRRSPAIGQRSCSIHFLKKNWAKNGV